MGRPKLRRFSISNRRLDHSRLQYLANEPQNAPVRYLFVHGRQKLLMVHRIEERPDVGVHHPFVAMLYRYLSSFFSSFGGSDFSSLGGSDFGLSDGASSGFG